MGTPLPDQQLRDALGTAADAFWDDRPPPHRLAGRRWVKAGMAAAVAVVVVSVAIVVAAVGTSPHPSFRRSRAPPVGRSDPRFAGCVVTVEGSGSGALGRDRRGRSRAIDLLGGAAAPTHSAPSPKASSTSVPSLPAGIVGQSAKVEMNGSANLTVGRGTLGAAVSALTNVAVGSGGYVADSSVQTGSPSPTPVPLPTPQPTPQPVTSEPGAAAQPVSPAPSANVTLEIPVAVYQGVVNRLGTVGKVTSLNTRAADVTGQYTDLQARITALEASRQQYLTIMTQATNISDILAVQNQIDQLQSQIEQLQGQLNVLDSETTYGTLAVSVVEAGVRVRHVPPAAARSGLSPALHDAVSGFLTGVDGLVRISGPVLFIALCLAVLAAALLGLVRWFRRPVRGDR